MESTTKELPTRVSKSMIMVIAHYLKYKKFKKIYIFFFGKKLCIKNGVDDYCQILGKNSAIFVVKMSHFMGIRRDKITLLCDNLKK
jgi:hypothetical protein